MTSIEDNLVKSGIILPEMPLPAGLYQPAKRIGELIYTSGQLPLVDGKLMEPGGKGPVTDEREQDAYLAARVAALNAVAALRAAVGNLDLVSQIIKLTVFVSSAPGFTCQHKVANGASQLVGEIFGESGRHVRSAVGVIALPLNASVEIELLAFSPLP
ncbi:MAG: RidA family protein [Chlorobiaceae bacterium]|nr:RidA family protein [Chlorobiaceae bacterium]